MLPLLETATAFATVMLAASLFVSALVQLLQKAGKYRAQTVRMMMKSVIHGFRAYHDDPDVLSLENEADPPKRAELQSASDGLEFSFVNDLLSDPAVHAREERLRYRDDPEKLAELVEFIHGDVVAALTYNYAKYYAAHGEHRINVAPAAADHDPSTIAEVEAAPPVPLPLEWVGGVASAPKAYATTANFAAYLARWFQTLESTATERFKSSIRRLTILLSCLLVVAFNLDGLHLLGDLYRSSGARDKIVAQAESLNQTAARLGVHGTNASDAELDNDTQVRLELEKTAAALGNPSLKIGWQDSWITARWCSFRGKCGVKTLPPTPTEIALDTLLWAMGLLFSCAMLSLGAPFWYGALSQILNLRNEVQKTTAPDKPPPPPEPAPTESTRPTLRSTPPVAAG